MRDGERSSRRREERDRKTTGEYLTRSGGDAEAAARWMRKASRDWLARARMAHRHGREDAAADAVMRSRRLRRSAQALEGNGTMPAKYSMDNPDPERHRPAAFDWQWEGSGAIEEGTADQLVTLTGGEWKRLLRGGVASIRELARRVQTPGGGFRKCAGCGSTGIRRYRASEDGRQRAGYCVACWQAAAGRYEPRSRESAPARDEEGRAVPTAGEVLAEVEDHEGPVAARVRTADGRDRYLLVRKQDVVATLRMQARASAAAWRPRKRGRALLLETGDEAERRTEG